MIQARVGVGKRVFCFDGAVANSALLSAVVKFGNTTVATLSFSAIGSIPNLYRSSEFTLSAIGQHEVVVTYNGSVIESYYVVAELEPASDYPLSEAVKLKLDPGALGVGATITARVVNNLGTVSSSLPAPYSAQKAAYEATHTFPAVGDYSVVWYQAINNQAVPFQMDQLYLATPPTREVIKFLAATTSGNGGTPHTNTTIVVVDEDLVVVGKTVTDAQGKTTLNLPPGSYTAALVRTGTVFSTNNINFTVSLGITSKPESNVPLISKALTVSSLQCTFTGDTPPAQVCTLSALLYRMDGTPLRHAVVRVALLHRPELFSGTAVFDTDLSFTTDTNGRVEFSLIRGIQVEISIAPLSLRRIITVPDAPTANILTLMSQVPDLFNIVAPVLPAATKRSL